MSECRVHEMDAIFSGAGALGIAYVGALRAVRDHGIWFSRVAGTSAGAFVAALIAAGYSADELEWLYAPPDAGVERPDSLPSSITMPISLSSFLDPPQSSNDISPATMRRTHLWKAIKLNAVDELLNRKLPGLPPRGRLTDDLTDKIVSLSFGRFNRFSKRINRILNTSLHFYPDDTPALGSFVPGTLERLRKDIADAAWRVFTDTVKDYRLFVSWAFEGGLFKGEVIYETARMLLEAKLRDSRRRTIAPVRFRHLPLELGVLTSDTSHPDRTKRLQVHTKLTAGNMEVARAVRDSMSVPLFFWPGKYTRGGRTIEIMDGGATCNYPFWLFTGGHEGYFNASANDDARPKLGFIPDMDSDAPPDWGCPKPKWHRPGSIKGMSPPNMDALAQNPEFAFLSPQGPFGEFVVIERALRVVEVIISSELTLTERWRSAIKATYPYYETFIPLKGYHWLDFTVNADAHTWRGIVDRGYEATIRTLIEAGLVSDSARGKNPYRVLR